MSLSNRKSPRSKSTRKTTRKTTSRKRKSAPKGRGGAARSRAAQREWNKKGRKPRRLSPLSSFLPILERREDKQHVVSYDPQEQDADGAPTRRTARRSSRGRQAPPARGRRTVREADEDLEEVQTTSRRRPMRGAPMQEEPDKIQIEVGSVKALSTKYGIVRGMTWMVLLSMLLWWVPVLGPATVGYVGGRKAGGPFRAAVAALVPLLFVFGAVAVTTSSVENVPLAIQHYISQGYNAVLGSLPFEFPLLAYIFANLGAVMSSGPDVLFTVLAFALVGGAVTQMRVHENSVPPITARLPKHRVVQGPARTYENANEALETLVARLAAVVERAERRGTSIDRASYAASDGKTHQRRGWSSPFPAMGRHKVPDEYPSSLQASPSKRSAGADGQMAMDSPSRQVVSAVLASTAPQAKGRAAKQAVRAARPVSLDIPQALAYAAEPGADATAVPLGTAHVYRPSKMYHIYGGTVNPVARKKLEKRLRRTHTLHAMRHGARSLVKQPDALPRSERGHLAEVEDLVEDDPEKPRSLERSAIGSPMRYDALEHLENATVAAKDSHKPKASKPKEPKPTSGFEEDELGGLIAHLGEGGEAVVDQAAVHEVEFTDGPVFDRRGRQRARIAPDEKTTAAKVEAPEEPKESAAQVAAQARKKREEAAREKARVDRWLEHTLNDIPDGPAKKAAPKAPVAPPPRPAKPQAAPPTEPRREAESPKARPEKPAAGKGAAPRFEVTHGSVEADAEADSDEEESSGPITVKRNRTAAQILKEIRQEKKDDKARKEQADAARRARDAKAAADEIERRIHEHGAGREPASDAPSAHDPDPAVVSGGGQAVALQATAKARRHRSEDLAAVVTTAEELSGELELTLDPVREEAATERAAHAAIAHLPMLDPEDPADADGPADEAGRISPETGDVPHPPEAGAGSGDTAAAAAEGEPASPEPERDVSPEDVVLAGPSTDTPGLNPEEAELSDNDREKIRKRLQEGWNRL